MAASARAVTTRRSSTARWTAFVCVSFGWLVLAPISARADGAFADSKTILFSQTDPKRIFASSDVAGLLVSSDGGESWSWICESAIGFYAGLFQVGSGPDENLYAITARGLASSSDHGCSWTHATGLAQSAGDVFPDPADPSRVLIVAQEALGSDNSLRSDVVAESTDHGQTFGPAMFMTDAASITGVEVARSDASVVYLTMSTIAQQHPYVVRSSDAGHTWTPVDLSLQLGRRPATLRIVAVDPKDPNTVYLRVSDGTRDALAITHDGGTTIATALQLESAMSAFLLRSDGGLIVASKSAGAFISRDGGATFTNWPVPFHVRALAEKAGDIFATADNRLDGFAIALSHDGGEHWSSLLQLERLRGPLACGSLAKQCAAEWQQLKPQLSALTGTFQADAGIEPVAPLPKSGSGCSVMRTAGPPLDRSARFAACGCIAAISGRRRLRTRFRRSQGDRSQHRTKETPT